jgi:hypothetical protein
MEPHIRVVQIIGEEYFSWLTQEFNRETTLADLPRVILDRVASVDMGQGTNEEDSNTVTAIALITFAYGMANRVQKPHLGPKDLLMLKVLAKMEKARRDGDPCNQPNPMNLPLFQLITGAVGDRLRAMPLPFDRTRMEASKGFSTT